jgi:hypothetical protein
MDQIIERDEPALSYAQAAGEKRLAQSKANTASLFAISFMKEWASRVRSTSSLEAAQRRDMLPLPPSILLGERLLKVPQRRWMRRVI